MSKAQPPRNPLPDSTDDDQFITDFLGAMDDLAALYQGIQPISSCAEDDVVRAAQVREGQAALEIIESLSGSIVWLIRERCAPDDVKTVDAWIDAVLSQNEPGVMRQLWARTRVILQHAVVIPVARPPDLGGKTKGKGINERMMRHLQSDTGSKDWTAKQWGKFLGCTPAMVCKTRTWEIIQELLKDTEQGARQALQERSQERSKNWRKRKYDG